VATQLDHTHDAAATSWLASANQPGSDFPIQNLPFGVFRRKDSDDGFRVGIALGDAIVDVSRLEALRHGPAAAAAGACAAPALNPLMACGRAAWLALRHAVFEQFRSGATQAVAAAAKAVLVPQDEAEFDVQAAIGDYTDYFTSIDHAINGGRLLDPDYKLARSFQWLPMAYHGRVSSVAIAGQHFHRPRGQVLDTVTGDPVYAPTRRLDFELELGVFVGQGNALGRPVNIEEAEDRIFGLCMLNDWSARDIQAFEMFPLGPFQSKNFATTLSPWVVTLDALAPFRSPPRRTADAPPLLPHLHGAADRQRGAIDIQLQVSIETAAMRSRGLAPEVLCTTSFVHQYWTISQMLVHHTAGGCNLRIGDLIGTGTISGPGPVQAGSMIELSEAGRTPLRLADGERRSFVEDGDAIVYRGWCEREGFRRIGFGANRGTVEPAL
jgi:fumarylacetoacetase